VKTAALLFLAALLAPVALIAAHSAQRRAWPAMLAAAVLLAALILGACIGPNW
jgi:hypothetical protein